MGDILWLQHIIKVQSPDIHDYIVHVLQTFSFPGQGGHQCSMQLFIQPWICALGNHYGWGGHGSVGHGSVEYEVCPTLLHMTSTGNQTPDF